MEELIEFLNLYDIDDTRYDIVDGYLVIKDEYINLSHTRISKPMVVNSLYLPFKKITKLPDSIGYLKVNTLYLNNNLLTELPMSFKDMKVKSIHLNDNCLTEIELSNDIDYLCCDKSVIIKGEYPQNIVME